MMLPNGWAMQPSASRMINGMSIRRLIILTALAGLSSSPLEAQPHSAAPDTPSSGTSVPSLAATIAAMPKGLTRATGPALADALTAAEAAQRACMAKGVPVSVLIADTTGEPVVLLSGDGAGVRSQLIARTKANIVAKYKMPSGDVAEKAKTDASLAAAASADPSIGMLRAGGFPLMRNGAMVGIAAVSGGSLKGDMGLDEACSRVAVREFEQH
jgi:uncharacterized protein GlcG (DUF336 family)